MLLSRYGLREWGIATAVAALLCIGVFVWSLPPALYAVVGVLWLGVVAFFRDPLGRRPASNDPADMVSPADGKVSAVFTVPWHDAIGGPATVVRIFLSVLDVHINRAPCAGTVEAIEHRPGKYLDARTEESARVNESNTVRMRTEGGDPIGVRQVSGAIARHIVCAVVTGDRLDRAERFGLIKFGSTTELILPRPEAVEVRVKIGDRVTGGVTILARLAPDRTA
ncbi:MAG: phosphatidylserine decarboxylase [Bacteroidia bacterium]|nr:phosphatidylserine decarboxylase [Bacteroidia bacterium]